jgi:hypothetical protein
LRCGIFFVRHHQSKTHTYYYVDMDNQIKHHFTRTMNTTTLTTWELWWADPWKRLSLFLSNQREVITHFVKWLFDHQLTLNYSRSWWGLVVFVTLDIQTLYGHDQQHTQMKARSQYSLPLLYCRASTTTRGGVVFTFRSKCPPIALAASFKIWPRRSSQCLAVCLRP